jgi:putative (di)nucleoside polyphosphate hydrolase
MKIEGLQGKNIAYLDDDVVDGYRPNVGIVLCNTDTQVLWARRSRHDGWQFPQGGIESNETAEEAVYRELYEEIGLLPQHVDLIGTTQKWLHYDVPIEFKRLSGAHFRGQKQMWFLFKMLTEDSDICLDIANKPEFDCWRWVDYWTPLQQIIAFKRGVYKQALTELEPFALQVANSPKAM